MLPLQGLPAAMSDVTDSYKELDNIEEVRDRLRDHAKLLIPAKKTDEKKDGMVVDMQTLALNKHQLLVWLRRMSQDEELRPPKVADIYRELLLLYRPYGNCKQTELELADEMWEARRCLVKVKELGSRMKRRRVLVMALAGTMFFLRQGRFAACQASMGRQGDGVEGPVDLELPAESAHGHFKPLGFPWPAPGPQLPQLARSTFRARNHSTPGGNLLSKITQTF